MGREDYHALGVGFGAFRTIGVVCVRLAAGPAGDGVLKFIEHLDVHVVAGAVYGEQFAETVVVIVLIGELENRFAGLLAQPHNGAAYQFVVPFACGHHPGGGKCG